MDFDAEALRVRHGYLEYYFGRGTDPTEGFLAERIAAAERDIERIAAGDETLDVIFGADTFGGLAGEASSDVAKATDGKPRSLDAG